MSHNIKVKLPMEFNPEKRAYFYQSLAMLDYYLLPGTNVQLVLDATDDDKIKKYKLEISFNNTVVKTSLDSGNYHEAIKKMMETLQGKFSEILEVVNKKSKSKKNVNAEDNEDKVIH